MLLLRLQQRMRIARETCHAHVRPVVLSRPLEANVPSSPSAKRQRAHVVHASVQVDVHDEVCTAEAATTPGAEATQQAPPICWWALLPDALLGDIFINVAHDDVGACTLACVNHDCTRVYTEAVEARITTEPTLALHGMWGGRSIMSMISTPGHCERALVLALSKGPDTYIKRVLQAPKWLDDQAIDEYLAVFIPSAMTLDHPRPLAFMPSVLTTMNVPNWFEMARATQLWRQDDDLAGAATCLSVMLDSRQLLFPVCMDHHWFMLVRTRRKNLRPAHWFVFDSWDALGLGYPKHRIAAESINRWLRNAFIRLRHEVGAGNRLASQEHLLELTAPDILHIPCAQQGDGGSCGAFLLAFARAVQAGADPGKVVCELWRQHIGITLAVQEAVRLG